MVMTTDRRREALHRLQLAYEQNGEQTFYRLRFTTEQATAALSAFTGLLRQSAEHELGRLAAARRRFEHQLREQDADYQRWKQEQLRSRCLHENRPQS